MRHVGSDLKNAQRKETVVSQKSSAAAVSIACHTLMLSDTSAHLLQLPLSELS